MWVFKILKWEEMVIVSPSKDRDAVPLLMSARIASDLMCISQK